MLKHPVYRHRPRPWLTNPIKGSIALPMDCNPEDVDWEPLVDSNSTVDTPAAAHGKGKHDRNNPPKYIRRTNEKTTLSRPATVKERTC